MVRYLKYALRVKMVLPFRVSTLRVTTIRSGPLKFTENLTSDCVFFFFNFFFEFFRFRTRFSQMRFRIEEYIEIFFLFKNINIFKWIYSLPLTRYYFSNIKFIQNRAPNFLFISLNFGTRMLANFYSKLLFSNCTEVNFRSDSELWPKK